MKQISHFNLEAAEFLLQLRLKEMNSSIEELKQLVELSEYLQNQKQQNSRIKRGSASKGGARK